MIRPNLRHWLLVALAVLAAVGQLLLATPAQSTEVFKCTARSGQVEFTDAPCGTNQASAVVHARPNSLDNSAVREQLLKIENRALQDKLAAAQATSATPTPGQAGPSNIGACRSAQRDLEFATSSIDKNRALIRARQSAMYAACGLREPDRQVTNVNVDVGQRADRAHRPEASPRRNAQ